MKLCDITTADIISVCGKYSDNFTADCPAICPFYMRKQYTYFENGKSITINCKTAYGYIKKHPNEEVDI